MDKNELRPRGERVFFASGDTVRIKHAIDNKPDMLVQSVDKVPIGKVYGNGETGKGALLGVTCIWFTTTGEIQKHRFNTKDLEKINE